jgi:DNA-binding HxlR family transcriptional regulator
MLGKEYAAQDCSMARTLEVVGERWTLLIVRDALYGVRRFNDFQAHLDIPKAVLSDRLSGLAADGVLERLPDPDRPGRHVYELTRAGRDLWPVLHALLTWGVQHRQDNSRAFRHSTCGTELAPGAVCPTCELTPPVGEIVSEPRRGRKSRRQDPVAVALRGPRRLLEPIEI